MTVQCEICPHGCRIEEGHTGLCAARSNVGGKVACTNYGKITALALDPIEKKPLYRFHPGSNILSVGSYGCNLRCPFCQNCGISMVDMSTAETVELTPAQLIDKALSLRSSGNIGIAYTYNEPLIGYEFVYDCAGRAAENGLVNVLVTNGYVCEAPLYQILPRIDGMNIDLKGFSDGFYKTLGGDLETVKRTIAIAVARCHVEVTTLIIPGENDSDAEMDAQAAWLAELSPEIPLHLSRFFPRYKYAGKSPTPPETLYRLQDIARQHLKFVYLGNI